MGDEEKAKEVCIVSRYYPTARHAEEKAEQLRKMHGIIEHPFKCQVCGGYHLLGDK